ncbi:hypothetical protein B0T24DRAFT_596550 [Lasiosphaeria ovina]|uniref:Uncharacterized protein n=1 Tax=Lasiosphaeria ovina TaxID=92902 RepID=A0AAE0JYF4_9PEZI|nr:hypothetical protein B0T24DRAFT_596550 [Lasiosphaeria ovina]
MTSITSLHSRHGRHRRSLRHCRRGILRDQLYKSRSSVPATTRPSAAAVLHDLVYRPKKRAAPGDDDGGDDNGGGGRHPRKKVPRQRLLGGIHSLASVSEDRGKEPEPALAPGHYMQDAMSICEDKHYGKVGPLTASVLFDRFLPERASMQFTMMSPKIRDLFVQGICRKVGDPEDWVNGKAERERLAREEADRSLNGGTG